VSFGDSFFTCEFGEEKRGTFLEEKEGTLHEGLR
jgi:hypothetical protein